MKEVIGKKISVKIKDRDDLGKTIEDKFTTVTGICIFCGYNYIISEFVIVIDRLPIFPSSFNDIVKIHD